MDGGKVDADGSTEPKLTRDIVQSRIDYGDYVVAYDTKSTSLAYKHIKKVFVKNGGAAVQYWFYCPYCKELLYQNVSIGTTPLLRHLRIQCSKIPADIRQDIIQSQHTQSKQKNIQNPQTTAPASSSSTHTASSTQQPSGYVPFTLDQMADALFRANRIGSMFGETLDSDTYKRLLVDSNAW